MVYSVQIKRSRNEDPIEALVVRGAKRKRVEDDEEDPFVFRLAWTYDSEQTGKHVILENSKRVAGTQAEHVFEIAEKKRKRRSSEPAKEVNTQEDSSLPAPENTDLVPAELQTMIAEYMNAETTSKVALNPEDSDKETEDYVFDVYFSDKAGPVASGNIGYIGLRDVEEGQEKLLFGESNSESDSSLLGEEDDSNAEDHYKNEYPDEDEDDDDDDDDDEYNALKRSEEEFGSDIDELLGGKMSDLRLDPEWSEDDQADDEDTRFNRYGWR